MNHWSKKLVVLAAVTVLAAFAASCGSSEGDDTASNPAAVTSENTLTDVSFPQQSSQSGNVNVSVAPQDISGSATTWSFKVVLDSQGPDLNEDVAAAAVIIDDNGKEFPAKGFEGDDPGSKHREGTLTFDAINPTPKSVTMKIRGVGGVGERSFSWTASE